MLSTNTLPGRLGLLLVLGLSGLLAASCIRTPPLRPLRPATVVPRTSTSVAFDRQGNRVVVGTFAQPIRLGEAELKSRGGTDIYVAKIAPDGRTLWARTFGGPQDQAATGVAVDDQDHIVIAGTFEGDLVL